MYQRFEALMKKRGVKAADVAKATGIGRSTFTDWKNGRSRPKREKMEKIAAYLGTSVAYLSGSPDEETNANLGQGVIIGFGGEQEPIEITEHEYEAIKAILKTLRSDSKDK